MTVPTRPIRGLLRRPVPDAAPVAAPEPAASAEQHGDVIDIRFWEGTMTNLSRAMGVADPNVATTRIWVDRRLQWQYARNIRYSAELSKAPGSQTVPGRWWRSRSA